MKPFLALLGFPAAVIAQSGGTGNGFDFFASLASIGIGAILAVPFVIVWRIAMQRIRDLETEVTGLHEQRLADKTTQIDRERELADVMAPLLEQAAKALRDTPGVFDSAIERAQGTAQRTDNDLRLRQIELAVDTMLHKLQRGPADENNG